MIMNKSTLINAPSLLDAAGPATSATPGLLSSLDGAASHAADMKQSRSAFRFIVIPLALIGLLAIAAAMIAGNTATSFRPLDSSATSPIAQAASKSGVTAAAKPRPAAAEDASPQVATIINDSANTVEKQTEPAMTSSNAMHDRLSAALASPQRDQAVETSKAASAAKSVNAMPAASKVKAAHADSEDRDVKLLTALIATNKDIPVKKENHAHASGKIPAGKNAKTKDDKRNQDIVERKPGDSTASLLIRCKKLGLIEGELCRWRICSERWDSDPACKANSQSKTSAADNPNQ